MNLYLYLQHASVGRERESELSMSVSVSINKSAADCSGFSLEMVKRWSTSNMLLNRNCCCRSLFIIGIETRLVSLCFLLSTSFYRKEDGESVWGRRSRHCCGGRTYMSGGQFLVRMRNILSKKKKTKNLSRLSQDASSSLPRQTDSSLLLLRFLSELHLFLGNLFVYISYVCVRQVNALRINPEWKWTMLGFSFSLFFERCQQQFPYLITPIT